MFCEGLFVGFSLSGWRRGWDLSDSDILSHSSKSSSFISTSFGFPP